MTTTKTRLTDIQCECGGTFRQDTNGRAICRTCATHAPVELFLARGLSPMWHRGTLVTHAGR